MATRNTTTSTTSTNTIINFFLAQVIGKKGFSTAQSWAAETAAFLESIGFTAASTAVKAWIGRGASKSTTSRVAYQKQDNQGVFPPEQVYCNLRGRRPRQDVARAIALALSTGRDYNPDRFSESVTVDGLLQGLAQFTKLDQFADRVSIYKEVNGKKLVKKDAMTIARLTEIPDGESRNDRLSRMKELANRLAALDPSAADNVGDYIAKYGKLVPTEAEPVKTEAEPVKTEAEPVKTEAEPVKTEAEPVKTGRRRLTAK